MSLILRIARGFLWVETIFYFVGLAAFRSVVGPYPPRFAALVWSFFAIVLLSALAGLAANLLWNRRPCQRLDG